MSDQFGAAVRIGSLVVLLMASAGCKSGGSGVSGLFEFLGGGSGSSGDSFDSESDFVISSSSGSVFDGGSSSSSSSGFESVADVQAAEPASIALFGTGLAALLGLRRRRIRQQASKS